MNRRDLIKRAFAVGAAGLMLPVAEPVRKVWALDSTMIPITRLSTHQVIGDPVVESWDTQYFIAMDPGSRGIYQGDFVVVQCFGANDWRIVG